MRLRARDLTFLQYSSNINEGFSLPTLMLLSLLPAVPCAALIQLVVTALTDIGFWSVWLFVAVYVCFQAALLISLSSVCFDKYFIADMPWSNVATWVFVAVFLALPIGGICLLVSYKAMKADRRAEHETLEGLLPQEVAEAEIAQEVRDLLDRVTPEEVERLWDDILPPEPPQPAVVPGVNQADDPAWLREARRQDAAEAELNNEIRVAKAKYGPEGSPYYSSPNAVRERYIDLRSEYFGQARTRELRAAQSRVDDAQSEIDSLKQRCTEATARAKSLKSRYGDDSYDFRSAVEAANDLAKQLRAAQATHNALKATLKQLTAADSKAVTAKTAADEFTKLLALPNVQAVQLMDGDIRVIVTPRIKYRRVKYDLGDWGIRFGEDGRVQVRLIREGLRPEWLYHGIRHPAYRYVRDHGRFCFSGREPELDRLAASGQFYELVALAVECMHHINPEDRQYIPEAYQRS